MAENAGVIYYEVDAKTDKVIDAGKRATNTLDNLQASFDKTDKAAAGLTEGLRKTAKMTEEEARALGSLLGKIDPVVAATKKLDQMQDQLSAAFAKGQINAGQYQAYLAKLDAQYAKLNGSTDNTQKKTNSFGNALTPLAAAVGAVITAQTLKTWGLMAEQFSLFQTRIARLSPDLDTAASSYNQLLLISGKTGQSMAATVKLWESLTSTLKEFGATNSQVLQLTSTLQKIGTIGGSSATEVAQGLRQLQQGLSLGTLRAEEFNSVVENTPELGRQIAKGFGVSLGQLRQMMLDGKISAEKLFEVLLNRSQDVNTEFEKLPRTITQAANALTTQFGAALSVIDKATKSSYYLAKALDLVAKGVQQSFNPTDQEQLNKLLQDRVVAEEQYATQVKFGLKTTADATSQRIDAINAEIKAIQDRRVAQQKEESAGTGKRPGGALTVTSDGQKAIQQLADQNVLLRAQGVERAKLAAIQKLGANATDSERAAAIALAVENYNLSEAEKARTKAKRAGASEASKLETKAQAEARRAAKELQTANDADQKQFTQLGQAIANVGQTAREAAQDAAQLSLSKFATPDEVQRIRDMAGALYDLKGARAALAQADPIAAQQQNYDDQLKQLQTLNEQKLLSDTRYLELKHQAEVANSEAMKTLNEENFKAQALGNEILLNSIDALGQSATQGIAGIISGTGSLNEALSGIANTVLQTVVGAFVQMGTDWVKQQIMMRAAATATTAAQVGGIGAVTVAQTAATGTIAATTTATAATTGTAVAGAMAPAAGLASIASFGGAAVIGGAALLATMLLAKSFGGGRRAGGAVSGSSVYRVNEGGAPEIFTAGGQQYMIPNQRGQIVNNRDAQDQMSGGGGGAAPIVNINNYSGQGATTTSRYSEADRAFIVEVIVGDQMSGGKSAHSTNTITGTRRAGN